MEILQNEVEKTSTYIEKLKDFISAGINVMAVFHVEERWFQMEVNIYTRERVILECVDKKDNHFVESKSHNMLRVLNITQGKMCDNKCTKPPTGVNYSEAS